MTQPNLPPAGATEVYAELGDAMTEILVPFWLAVVATRACYMLVAVVHTVRHRT